MGSPAALTCEPPPSGAAAGKLHHPRGKHKAEEQPTNQPEGHPVMRPPGRRAPLQQVQGSHQNRQEARLQEKAVPDVEGRETSFEHREVAALRLSPTHASACESIARRNLWAGRVDLSNSLYVIMATAQKCYGVLDPSHSKTA